MRPISSTRKHLVWLTEPLNSKLICSNSRPFWSSVSWGSASATQHARRSLFARLRRMFRTSVVLNTHSKHCRRPKHLHVLKLRGLQIGPQWDANV
jgi:hypothetical protein